MAEPQHAQWTACSDLYDLEYESWTELDLPFYLHAARQRPPLLELACGTGRLAIPIARAGVEVVGLDASPQMLARAQAKAGALDGLRLVEGLMEDFELGERFGTIIIAFSSFYVLASREAQAQTLARIRDHLAPGGRLIMDMLTLVDGLFGPALPAGAPAPALRLDETLREAQTGRRHEIWQSSHHDPASQRWEILREVRSLDRAGEALAAPHRYVLSGRYVSAQELAQMLRQAGLEPLSVHAGFAGEPFDASSRRMVWTAGLATPP